VKGGRNSRRCQGDGLRHRSESDGGYTIVLEGAKGGERRAEGDRLSSERRRFALTAWFCVNLGSSNSGLFIQENHKISTVVSYSGVFLSKE